jgi:hypothetical protein
MKPFPFPEINEQVRDAAVAKFKGKYSPEVMNRALSILDTAQDNFQSFTETYESIELALNLWSEYAREYAKRRGLIK